MIDVSEALATLPAFDRFCSVRKLHELVESLRSDPRFAVELVGKSVNGLPIHHVTFGRGSVTALFVGGLHAPEPIGSLTVFSLLTQLSRANAALCSADVNWHIVPCIDPDGALLNEDWTQEPFTLQSYMKGFYVQAVRDQVDTSFPVSHKRLVMNQPSLEAKVLRGVLDRIRPDFYFALHNAWAGGAFYFLSRDIGQGYYAEISKLLEKEHFPIQRKPIWKEVCTQFGDGFVEMFSVRKHYDYLEQTVAAPEEWVQYGAASWDYLAEIKPEALSFVAEMGYVRHPSDESVQDTGGNLRRFQVRLSADSMCFASALLEEWEKVKSEVDTKSPFFRAIQGGMVLPAKEKVCEGGVPITRYPLRDILFNPIYDRAMTEGDRFNACITDGGFLLPLLSYQLVRLLKASPPTVAVREATERLERAFAAELDEIGQHIDLDAFEVVSCNKLVRVQLGSGLIALNSVLEHRVKDVL